MKKTASINELIRIVTKGGGVRTGTDILDSNGNPLLSGKAAVNTVQGLLTLKRHGISEIRLDTKAGAALWDKAGKSLIEPGAEAIRDASSPHPHDTDIKSILSRMEESCLQFKTRYEEFQPIFKDLAQGIRKNNGRIDAAQLMGPIQEMVSFLMAQDPSFSFLNRNPLTPENYLASHAINVCTIGSAVLKRFNDKFSSIINRHLSSKFSEHTDVQDGFHQDVFIYYVPEAILEIATGYFMHDIGKLLIPEDILHKQTPLSEAEQQLVHAHSFDKGAAILEMNQIGSLYIKNVVKWHHIAIHSGEKGGYPEGIHPIEIPPYVKIAKIVDIYDAMTSKRTYGEAADPAGVVAHIYRMYAGKDPMLQYILHAFISEMGVCPTGSVVHLRNGQLAFVLERHGPIVLPLTDPAGTPFKAIVDPLDISALKKDNPEFEIDRRKAPLPPAGVVEIIPTSLTKTFSRISILGSL